MLCILSQDRFENALVLLHANYTALNRLPFSTDLSEMHINVAKSICYGWLIIDAYNTNLPI